MSCCDVHPPYFGAWASAVSQGFGRSAWSDLRAVEVQGACMQRPGFDSRPLFPLLRSCCCCPRVSTAPPSLPLLTLSPPYLSRGGERARRKDQKRKSHSTTRAVSASSSSSHANPNRARRPAPLAWALTSKRNVGPLSKQRLRPIVALRFGASNFTQRFP